MLELSANAPFEFAFATVTVLFEPTVYILILSIIKLFALGVFVVLNTSAVPLEVLASRLKWIVELEATEPIL